MSIDLEKAIVFIEARGNDIEYSRLEAILWEQKPPDTVIQKLASLQYSDGSFAHWVAGAGNLCDTSYVLQWLDDLGLHADRVAQNACRFIQGCQLPDGGWDEDPSLADHKPPEWLTPGRIETRVWLTGFCAHMSIRFGFAEAPGSKCPTGFLLANCEDSGRMTGYFRATWLALPMLAFHPGDKSKPFLRSLAFVAKSFSSDWDSGYLGWLLRCLYDSGVPAEHPLASRCLDSLEQLQHRDGYWDPEEGEGPEHIADATLTALRALRRYGRI